MLLDNFSHNALAVIDNRCTRLYGDDTEESFLQYFDAKYPKVTIAGISIKASEVLRECNQTAFLSLWDDWLMSPECKDYYLIKFNKDDFRIYEKDDVDTLFEEYTDYDYDHDYDLEKERD